MCDGKAGRILCSSPIEAEALAILAACQVAADDHVPSTILSDSKVLVDDVQSDPSLWPWRCFAPLNSITKILRCSSWIRLSFAGRQNNKKSRLGCTQL
ncbi:unnamed protein product [Linum trigynum]|uniref:RNase H type-1 domain-containing protein n=1 Tax=Linum trigynum TaxID=586398 RepID=A0AAV2GDX7_9ROSI